MPITGGNTFSFTVTNSAYSAVTVQSYCRVVTMRESLAVAGSPTGDFLVAKPTQPGGGVVAHQEVSGSSYVFTAPPGAMFIPQQVIGYVEMVLTASTTFVQDEQG